MVYEDHAGNSISTEEYVKLVDDEAKKTRERLATTLRASDLSWRTRVYEPTGDLLTIGEFCDILQSYTERYLRSSDIVEFYHRLFAMKILWICKKILLFDLLILISKQ